MEEKKPVLTLRLLGGFLRAYIAGRMSPRSSKSCEVQGCASRADMYVETSACRYRFCWRCGTKALGE